MTSFVIVALIKCTLTYDHILINYIKVSAYELNNIIYSKNNARIERCR